MKSSTKFLLHFLFLPLTFLTISSLSTSQPKNATIHQSSQNTQYKNLNTIIAWALSFITAAFSSACGVGGGSLFLPILTVVAGLSLKSATAFNSFMVSAGALCNVIYAICFLDRTLVNYEIALLSQPGMLLGVSLGVLCNFMFPEWLITALFAVVLAVSTGKTVQSGCNIWSSESEERVRLSVEINVDQEREGIIRHDDDYHVPLLEEKKEGKGNIGDGDLVPWKDMMVLVMIWMCFFVLHILLGDKNGEGLIDIKPCGLTFWLLTISQIPIAIGFTWYILHTQRENHEHANDVCNSNKSGVTKGKYESFPRYVFPMAAMLTGALSGLFGIGGGLILNPAFLQIGLPPQAAAATSSLMVLFSASMSMAQYTLLGMRMIDEALKYGLLSLVASAIGLVIMHKIISRSGRVSLVVFMVSLVMALSTVIITLFGVIDVWRQIGDGEYMGFKLLC